MRLLTAIFAILSILFCGAIFGFFFAWVCSTMWGLDTLNPNVAIAAMQAMNASVRNGVFAPAFFGTPIVLIFTALLALIARQWQASQFFVLGAIFYGFGGLLLTIWVHVPMNETLAEFELPVSDARALWDVYSPRWQLWNQVRTGFSGLALLCAAVGLALVRPKA